MTPPEFSQATRRDLPRLVFDGLVLTGCAIYVLVFIWRQTQGLLNAHLLEWDARAMALPAWRYHGTGLFPGDYVVDFVSTMNPPVCKLIFWLGTLLTNPFTLSKLVPFALLGVVVWQGFCIGYHAGGAVMGGATALLFVHCPLLWDRMVGATARAFCFPLMVTFLRYAIEGAERRSLATLLIQSAAYPLSFILCAPAYGLTLLLPRPRRGPILRLAALSALALAIMVAAMWQVDPRFGHPTSLAQAATLPQMGPGGNQPFYPLERAESTVKRVKGQFLGATGKPVWPALQRWNDAHDRILVWILAFLLAVLAGRRLLRFPPVLVTLFLSSLFVFWLTRVLAFRLHIPDRVLIYSWPTLLIVTLTILASLAARRIATGWGMSVGAVVLVVFHLAIQGDGLPVRYGMWDWGAYDTPTIRYLSGLPRDTLIAAHLRTSSFVQYLALRRTLFSSTSNVQNYYGYAREMERRIGDYYRAYYASDVETVHCFAATHHVDYLVIDLLDFGPDALRRSVYTEPWTSLAASLLRQTPASQMFFANPPGRAVVFRDRNMLVIDLAKL